MAALNIQKECINNLHHSDGSIKHTKRVQSNYNCVRPVFKYSISVFKTRQKCFHNFRCVLQKNLVYH